MDHDAIRDRQVEDLLRIVQAESLRCPKCEYPLGSLAECRCPECGREFEIQDWKEHGLTEEIATLVRLRGPITCDGCEEKIAEALDAKCPACGRRVRKHAAMGLPPPPVKESEMTPLAKSTHLASATAFVLLAIVMVTGGIVQMTRRVVPAPRPLLDLIDCVFVMIAVPVVVLYFFTIWVPLYDPDRYRYLKRPTPADRFSKRTGPYHVYTSWLSWILVGLLSLFLVRVIANIFL